MGKLKLLKQFQQHFKNTRMFQRINILVLLLLISSNVFSKSYSQTELSLNFKNTEVEKVISFIERRTDYRFLYQTSEVNLKRKVNIKFKGKIGKAVRLLFQGTAVYPVIVNKQIVLKNRIGFTQNRTLTGTVTDADKIPLEGVTVLVNSYERGTTTDANGKYKVSVKKGDKISFSFMGFKTQELVIDNQSVVNIVLEDDIDLLDEIVLIGYGKEKKANISTAISTVKPGVVKTNLQSGSTFDKGLDGLMKGVLVTQGTGELGRNADIIIRGVTSPFTGKSNNPLFIIDGVPLRTPNAFTRGSGEAYNPLQAINPEDIESIDVLKDAASTAIYGSRGANGVIIVKTKSGVYNQPTTVNLSASTTIGTPINTLDYLNATEFKNHILTLNKNSLDYYNKNIDNEYIYTLSSKTAFGFSEDKNGKIVYDPSKIKFGNANTNWSDVVYRSAAITNQFNINISGGSEKSSHTLSLGHTNQEGLLRADERTQYNARLSTNFNVFDNLKTGVSVNYVYSNQNSGYGNTTTQSFSYLGSQLRFRPDLPVYDENGKFTSTTDGSTDPTITPNPLAITTLSNQTNLLNHYVLANIFAEYNITDNLSFKTDFSYGTSFSDSRQYRPKEYSIDGFNRNSKSELSLNNVRAVNSVLSYTLNYNKSFGNHNLAGLLGYSHTKEKNNIKAESYKDFISTLKDPQFAKTLHYSHVYNFPSGINSIFTRFSYNFKEKYGVSSVVRWDRSSVYHPNNRSEFFPSASAYWNINKEDFMQDNFFSELRLRASVGQTGSAAFEKFSYLQLFSVLGTDTYRGQPSIAFDETLANKNLKWEKTTEYNVGLNFAEKRNRIRGSVDFYHKTSRDVVSNDKAPSSSGKTSVSKNSATILNKGFEISLGSDIINNENLTWTVDVNATKNINKLLAVSETELKNPFTGNLYAIGKEVNLIRGYKVKGIITDKARIDELNAKAKAKGYDYFDRQGTSVGDYEYEDLNGDGRITPEDGRFIIGSRQADLFGGFNTRLKYKGFSIATYFSYALGIESTRGSELFNNGKLLNVERHVSAPNRWSPTNTNATLPKLIHTNEEERNSDRNVFDSSYLRLTTLKFGYDLPYETIERVGLSKLHLYLTGTNLATWTNFPGVDPQGAIDGGASPEGTANSDAYPSARTFSLGVNIQF